MNDLLVLGGGATGLTVAYIAALSGRSVTLVEKSNELGGLLATFEVPNGDPLEFYYHHFFTHDVEIIWLLKALGLEEKIFFKETSMGFFAENKIFNFSTPKDLLFFSPLSLIGKSRFAATSLFLSKATSWKNYEDISALEWFYTYAGVEVTETIWKPMLEIKFGSYADKVPLAWMIGRLQQRMSSRRGSKEQLGYILGSSKELVIALTQKLKDLGVTIIQGQAVKEVVISHGTIKGLRLSEGDVIEAKQVVSTIPTSLLSSLLPESCGVLKSDLERVKYFGALCGIVFLKRPLSHIYWLNISQKGFPFGGVIEQTNFIPPSHYGGAHIAYLSRYVELDNPLLKEPVESIAQTWSKDLQKIYPDLKVDDITDFKVFKTTTAATICHRNFSAIVPHVETSVKNFYVLSMAHVYPDERSVNNSIRVAANFCEKIGIDSPVPKGRALAGQLGF